MSNEVAKAVVRRNTEQVQGRGNFDLFEELFADDFVDHTPQPNTTPDKAGVRKLYRTLRAAFPDFHAEIHWQIADGDRVTTYKTYHGTHQGAFLGVAPTGRRIHFETVDVMRVRDEKVTVHWGVANLFSLLQQLGACAVQMGRLADHSGPSCIMPGNTDGEVSKRVDRHAALLPMRSGSAHWETAGVTDKARMGSRCS